MNNLCKCCSFYAHLQILVPVGILGPYIQSWVMTVFTNLHVSTGIHKIPWLLKCAMSLGFANFRDIVSIVTNALVKSSSKAWNCTKSQYKDRLKLWASICLWSYILQVEKIVWNHYSEPKIWTRLDHHMLIYN